jgi:hypothetical protein
MNTHPYLTSMMAAERIADRHRDAARFRDVRHVRRTAAADGRPNRTRG